MADGRGVTIWCESRERAPACATTCRPTRHSPSLHWPSRGRGVCRAVQRHGPTVLAVCRRVLGESSEADDAFQATFLVLARKAEAETWHVLGTPLAREAAHRLSLHARAEQRRRQGREISVGSLPISDDGELSPEDLGADLLREVTRRELRRLLEEELDELPEKYRAPMVLCYLEGKTNQEAARQLGWATGSISRRLRGAVHASRAAPPSQPGPDGWHPRDLAGLCPLADRDLA